MEESRTPSDSSSPIAPSTFSSHTPENSYLTRPMSTSSVAASSTEGTAALEVVRRNLRFAFDDALPGDTAAMYHHHPARLLDDLRLSASASRAHDLREQLLRYQTLSSHPELRNSAVHQQATPQPAQRTTQSRFVVVASPHAPRHRSPPSPADEPNDSVSSMTLEHHLMDTFDDFPVHIATACQTPPKVKALVGRGTGKLSSSSSSRPPATHQPPSPMRPRGGVFKRTALCSRLRSGRDTPEHSTH